MYEVKVCVCVCSCSADCLAVCAVCSGCWLSCSGFIRRGVGVCHFQALESRLSPIEKNSISAAALICTAGVFSIQNPVCSDEETESSWLLSIQMPYWENVSQPKDIVIN